MTAASTNCTGTTLGVVSPVLHRVSLAVLLDFSGIILDDSPWKHWLWRAVCRARANSIDYSAFEDWYEERALFNLCVDFDAARDELATEFQQLGLSPPLVEELVLAAKWHLRPCAVPTPALLSVRDVIHQLRRQSILTVLAAIGRFQPSTIHHYLARMRLERAFDRIFIGPNDQSPDSMTTGWRNLIDQLGLSSDRLIFVGSHRVHLRLASMGGFEVVAVHHPAQHWHGPILEDLSQLPSWIAVRRMTAVS